MNEVFQTKENLFAAARETLMEIAEHSPNGVALSKNVIRSVQNLTIEEGLEIENQVYRTVFDHPEKTEGITAFLEKRKATFAQVDL